MNKPQVLSSNTIYKNNYIEVKVEKLSRNSQEWDQVFLHKPNKNGVCILPIDEKGIYLINQYRRANDRFLWQIPGGGIEDGESPEESAKQELLQETGIKAKKITKIGSVLAEPGLSTEETFIFVAEDFEEFGKQQLEVSEIGMEMKYFTFKELKEMIRKGEIVCGFMLSALALLQNNYLKRLI